MQTGTIKTVIIGLTFLSVVVLILTTIVISIDSRANSEEFYLTSILGYAGMDCDDISSLTHKIHLSPHLRDFIQSVNLCSLNQTDMEFLRKYENQTGFIIKFKEKPLAVYKAELERETKSKGIKTSSLSREYNDNLIKDYGRKIRDSQNRNVKSIQGCIPNKKVRRRFSNVFNGVSMEISAMEALRLLKLDFVEGIYPISKKHIMLNESVSLIHADDVWQLPDSQGRNITGKNVTIAIMDTGIDYTHPDLGNCTNTFLVDGDIENYSLESPHPYENDFHKIWTITMPGFKNIAVHFRNISTELGYDEVIIREPSGYMIRKYTGAYTDVWSPSVAGDTIKITLQSDSDVTNWGFFIDRVINGTASFSLNNCSKVIGGFDFVNNDYDPMDDHGHGTHCAGIAAGNGILKGVAPDAKLLAYKIGDYSGEGDDDDIIAAMDIAIDAGANIISISFGGPGHPDDAISQAVDNAVDSGIAVIVAAGNDGPDNGTISSPGCAKKAITVGATYKGDTGNRISELFLLNDTDNTTREIESQSLEYSALTDEGGITSELLPAGLGYEENFTAWNFTGKIALIERGGLYFYEKVQNAYEAGAVGAIIYNNVPYNFVGTLENLSEIPAISISQEDGIYLLNLTRNETIRVNMSVIPDPNIVADFSSRGPSYIYNKPDILAPGVMVCSARWNSAYPDSLCIDDRHIAMSGTSMATPHVAGAVALLLQEHPDWTPLDVKAALENTADDQGLDANTQGRGLINILSAIKLNESQPVAMISDIPEVTYR